MSDIVSPLFQWLNSHPELAGLVTFIISAGESVAIIGTIVPGSIMMTAIGTLAGAGIIPLYETILWAILGAIVGDSISYWIGHIFKNQLRNVWPFKRHPSLLGSGVKFFHKYGAMSVFIGRFVGPVRALVPLVAGMLGMKPWQFTLANITSAIGWAPAYMLPGILLGAASLELPPEIAVHVILALLLIGLFIMLCLWFVYKLLQLIHNQTTQLQNTIWNRLKKSQHFSSVTVLLKHYDPRQTHGQLSLAFYFLIAGLLFLALVIYVKIVGPQNIMINDATFHLFRGIRTDAIDTFMLNVSLLGQKQVMLPIVFVLCISLLIWKRWRTAFHALMLGVLAAGSVFVLKNIIQTQRPWGIFKNATSFSMPSGHATLSTTLFMGLAFLIARSLPKNCRWPIYTISLFIVFIVGLSRFYIGAHWLTDVLAGWLLSAALLIFVIISFQRKYEKPINPLGIFLVSLVTLIITFGVFHHYRFQAMKQNYAQISWPQKMVNLDTWWREQAKLPAERASLFGFPSEFINIEWLGDLTKIKSALEKEGWTEAPKRDWVSSLHRIADIKSTEYLPLISPQYLDKKPCLILIRNMSGGNVKLVLRLWDSHITIEDTKTTLWVGFVGIIPRAYSWIYKLHPSSINIDPTFVFPTKAGSGQWQWTMVTLHHPHFTQKMLLIRPNKLIHKKK